MNLGSRGGDGSCGAGGGREVDVGIGFAVVYLFFVRVLPSCLLVVVVAATAVEICY